MSSFCSSDQKTGRQWVGVEGGTIVDAAIIASTSSTKNAGKERDLEMHQTKKGNQWYHGMKCHAGVDAGTGLVHSVTFAAANVSDIGETHSLIRDDDEVVYGDAGYIGIEKRPEISGDSLLADKECRIAEEIGRRRRLKVAAREWADHKEKRKSSVRSKVEHVFRIVKIQFGYTKAACRGLNKGWRKAAHSAGVSESLHAGLGRKNIGGMAEGSVCLFAGR